ncbi:MAG TPA: hypothetical protein DCM62_01845 [Bacteroidales bacterium]|nr:hypothetical protein [Bacteroidales bacterium]
MWYRITITTKVMMGFRWLIFTIRRILTRITIPIPIAMNRKGSLTIITHMATRTTILIQRMSRQFMKNILAVQ